MSERLDEVEGVQLEELRPITLGPIATQRGSSSEGLTEEDWWFHLSFDNLWFKSCSD